MASIEMIVAARARLRGHARRTPLLSSPFLDEIAGRRLFVKAECLQHSGSFKFRGGWSAVSGIDPESRRKGVIAFSSGNHAQGVALAARMHGVPSVIIMPSDAPKRCPIWTPTRPSRTRLNSSSRSCVCIGAARARGAIVCSSIAKRPPVSPPRRRYRLPSLGKSAESISTSFH